MYSYSTLCLHANAIRTLPPTRLLIPLACKQKNYTTLNYTIIQNDQKFSVHLMITIQKVTSNVQSVPRQSPDVYWHAELCSRRRVQYSTVHIPIVFCDGHLHIINCVGTVRQVHRDFLIILYYNARWKKKTTKTAYFTDCTHNWNKRTATSCHCLTQM